MSVMHSARAWRSSGLLLFLACTGVSVYVGGARAQEDANKVSAASAIYVRSDTDRTTVITPRVELSAPIDEATRVGLVYAVDVWTSASIDIRTSASLAPGATEPLPVTEQRDELNASIEHAFPDVTIGGAYRYSTEIDYESHGGSLGGTYDFADNNASLSLSLRAYFDTIGRAGFPDFERDATLYSGRLAFTQVLDPDTLVQAVYELGSQRGYLSSPYRYVRFADQQGEAPSTCRNAVRGCLAEENPGSRMRHALAVSGRRALTDTLSLGLSYRFYLDDWDMTSHTVGVEGAWAPSTHVLLSLGYRLYRQSSVSHFSPIYALMPTQPVHYTSDKELTALTSHRVQFEAMYVIDADALGSELRTVLLVAPSHFLYHEFLLLDTISALEVTLALEVLL